MSLPRVTATDLQRAERFLECIEAKDSKALAHLLYEVRMELISCAVARVEREWKDAPPWDAVQEVETP